ncbi:MAG: lysophospholipid acyltransferase family protein [Proteobacteria bacterium]|nr:lysophospholipid acyltransferase family protein [Pseudomonadota bacterium]
MAAPALSFSQKLRYGTEAALFLAFMGFFRLIGVDAASAVGGFIGREIFARTRVTKRARDNLIAAFPEKSEGERDAIIRTMWDNLGRTVAEYAHLDKFDLSGPNPRIQVNNLEEIDKIRGKGALIVSGHFANWEIMPISASRYGIDGAIVYRPPNNPYVDRYIARARARKGYAEQISKHQGTRRIFTLLRGNKAILLLADQKTNEGIPVPFFGRDAMTTPAPAALALKLKVPMIFASNKRLGGARFAVTVYPPLDFTPSGDDDADMRAMTAAINLRLEEMVRADPGQWLWIHRRWPTERDVTTSKRL